MIRTRDFLFFALAFIFLSSGIAITLALGDWVEVSNVATVVEFDNQGSRVVGAEVLSTEIPRDQNILRLKSSLSAGIGDIPDGEPMFTSVDTVNNDTVIVSDDTPPSSIQLGFTTDGEPLLSENLWRFAWFTENDQVGVSLSETRIFGYHSNPNLLDQCGGFFDDGEYKLFLTEVINYECYK